MKEKIFSLASKVVSLFPISWETEREISNIANLVYLTLRNGRKHTFRHQAMLDISSDFFENYLCGGGLNDKVVRLKKNLDEKSQCVVDMIIKRHKYIYTHNLLDSREIYNQEELKKQKAAKSFYKKRKDCFPICDYPETFFYQNGLKILPDEIIKKISGKDVIDGGGFIGDSAIIFSKVYSFKKIYSFEPDSFNFIKLKRNIAKYEMKNVDPINKGLSSQEGRVNFNVQGVSSSIQPQGKDEIEITTIDKFVGSLESDADIGLIKLDVEGAESDVVAGSIKIIEKFRPVLLISIYHTGKDFFEIKPLLEGLSLGYKFIIRKINPNSPIGEVMLIAHIP
jgi:FkbM family methyltransferase